MRIPYGRRFRQAPTAAVVMLRGMLKFVPAERLSIEEALQSSLFTATGLPEAAARGVGDLVAGWLKQEYGLAEAEVGQRSSSSRSSSSLPFPPSVVRFDFEGITGTTASLEPFIEAEIRRAPSGLQQVVSDEPEKAPTTVSAVEVADAATARSNRSKSACSRSGAMSPPEVPAAKRPRVGGNTVDTDGCIDVSGNNVPATVM